jgi:hypothetical protein
VQGKDKDKDKSTKKGATQAAPVLLPTPKQKAAESSSKKQTPTAAPASKKMPKGPPPAKEEASSRYSYSPTYYDDDTGTDTEIPKQDPKHRGRETPLARGRSRSPRSTRRHGQHDKPHHIAKDKYDQHYKYGKHDKDKYKARGGGSGHGGYKPRHQPRTPPTSPPRKRGRSRSHAGAAHKRARPHREEHKDSRSRTPCPVRLSSRRREDERNESINPEEYLASIPPHLLPQAEGRASKGVKRRIIYFCRRLASARGTPWKLELARLEKAAAASNTPTRESFQAELYSKAHPASSSSGKGAGKGKGGLAVKSFGKDLTKMLGKHTSNTSKDKDKRPPSRNGPPPTGEVPSNPDNIKKETTYANEKDNPECIDYAGDEPEKSPSSSGELPVPTIPAGSSMSPPTGIPLVEQYRQGMFPKAALGHVYHKAITVLGAPEEHHWLFRGRPIGLGQTPPSWEGRRKLPLRNKSGTAVASTDDEEDNPEGIDYTGGARKAGGGSSPVGLGIAGRCSSGLSRLRAEGHAYCFRHTVGQGRCPGSCLPSLATGNGRVPPACPLFPGHFRFPGRRPFPAHCHISNFSSVCQHKPGGRFNLDFMGLGT